MVRAINIIKDALREIRFNKKRFLLLLLIVIISSGLYVGLKCTYKDMKKSILNYYNETNLFDIQLTQTSGFLESDIEKLKNIDGVKGVMLSKTLDVYASINGNNYKIRLNSINDDVSEDNDDYINQIILTSGNYPSTVNEGLVEESFLKEAGLEVGDLITLEPENEDDLRAKKIKIVGTFKSSYYSALNSGSDAYYYMYLTESDFTTNYYNYAYITLENSGNYDTYRNAYKSYVNSFINDIYSTIENGNDEKKESLINNLESQIVQLENDLYRLNQSTDSSLDEEKEEITETIASYENEILEIKNDTLKISTRLENDGFLNYQNELEKIKEMSNAIPIIFLFLIIVLCVSSGFKIADENKNEILTLKALGYNMFSILFKYVLYNFIVCLIGTIIGSLAFYKLVPLIINYFYSNTYNIPTIITTLQIKYVLFSVLFSTIFVCLLTIIVLVIKISINPRKKTKKEKKELKKKDNKITIKIKRIFEILSKINFKKIIISKSHVITSSVVTCVLISSLLILFGFKDSIDKTIKEQFNNINKYDIKIDLSSYVSDDEDDLVSKLSNLKKINAVKEIYFNEIFISKDDTEESSYLIIPKDNDELEEFIGLIDSDNNEISLPENGVIISNTLAKKLGIKENDTVRIRISNNAILDVKVSYISKNYINNYVYLSSSLYEELTGLDITYNSILLTSDNLSFTSMNNLKEKILSMDNVSDVTFKTEVIDDYKQSLSSINDISFTIMILVIILTFIIIYYLSWLNINHQKKNILILKSLGFYDKEINMRFLKENLTSLIIGYVIAMIFGTLSSFFIIKHMDLNNFIYVFKISIISYLLIFAIFLIMLFIINISSYFRLKKLSR